MERYNLDAHAQQSVDAYVEYDRIVGNADGGKTFSDAEFEAFKASVAEAVQLPCHPTTQRSTLTKLSSTIGNIFSNSLCIAQSLSQAVP